MYSDTTQLPGAQRFLNYRWSSLASAKNLFLTSPKSNFTNLIIRHCRLSLSKDWVRFKQVLARVYVPEQDKSSWVINTLSHSQKTHTIKFIVYMWYNYLQQIERIDYQQKTSNLTNQIVHYLAKGGRLPGPFVGSNWKHVNTFGQNTQWGFKKNRAVSS